MANEAKPSTVGGVAAYLDQLVEKNRVRNGVVKPLEIALRKVFHTVEGEGWKNIELSTLDLSDYMTRFKNATSGDYTIASLNAYEGRVRRAIHWYDESIKTPGWFPEDNGKGVKATSSKADAKSSDSKRKVLQKITASSDNGEQPSQSASSSSDEGMVSYPLLLLSGKVAKIFLPMRLTTSDAKRISTFVTSLALSDGDQQDEQQLLISDGRGQ